MVPCGSGGERSRRRGRRPGSGTRSCSRRATGSSARPGASSGAADDRRRAGARDHGARPELPRIFERAARAAPFALTVPAAAAARAGRHRAAERGPGQRGARVRARPRDRREHARHHGQRGDDRGHGRAGLPDRGRRDPGDLPVPGGDQRPGPVRPGRRAGRAAGKPIVVVKVGREPGGPRSRWRTPARWPATTRWSTRRCASST